MGKNKGWELYVILIVVLLIGATSIWLTSENPEKMEKLEKKAWVYIHPEDQNRDVSGWAMKCELINYGKVPAHEIYDIKMEKPVNLEGRQVYLVVFKSENPDVLGDINIYIDRWTQEVIGVDLRM